MIGTAANSLVRVAKRSAPATSAAPAKANAHAVSYWMRSSPSGMAGAGLLACQPVMTSMQNATTASPAATNSTPVRRLVREASSRIAYGASHRQPGGDRVMLPPYWPVEMRRGAGPTRCGSKRDRWQVLQNATDTSVGFTRLAADAIVRFAPAGARRRLARELRAAPSGPVRSPQACPSLWARDRIGPAHFSALTHPRCKVHRHEPDAYSQPPKSRHPSAPEVAVAGRTSTKAMRSRC